MDHWDSRFYPHCILFSFMEIYKGSNVLPKYLKDLRILYHSNLTHPYHSIPPHSTISCLPFPAGIHHALFPKGSPAFKCCPASLHPPAVWTQRNTHLPSVYAGFITHLPRFNCLLLSHASGLFAPSTMSSPRIRSHPHSTLGLGSARYVISPECILLDVIAGVNEGWL